MPHVRVDSNYVCAKKRRIRAHPGAVKMTSQLVTRTTFGHHEAPELTKQPMLPTCSIVTTRVKAEGRESEERRTCAVCSWTTLRL